MKQTLKKLLLQLKRIQNEGIWSVKCEEIEIKTDFYRKKA